jgi:carbamoyltransferase
MKILGISAFYHDAAAALIVDGRLVAAAQEERFSRKKHDADFPSQAIQSCLEQASIGPDQMDVVVFYDKPLLKFERILVTHIATWPWSLPSFLKAMPSWLKRKLWVPRILAKELEEFHGPILYSAHHLSHAASAFYCSQFDEAAVLTVDGVGEWATCTLAHGQGNKLRIIKEIRFPHSLGLLYSTITGLLGFRVNSGEYKVMGLAPYGEPVYADALRKLLRRFSDGSFSLDLRHFSYVGGLQMYSSRLSKHLDLPPRSPESPIEQKHMNLARSIQVVTEEAMLGLAESAHAITGAKDLCLAGGVALNCVANTRILKDGPFDNVFVQPAAGDAGGAIGAAAYVAHAIFNEKRHPLEHVYLGPEFGPAACDSFVAEHQLPNQHFESEDALLDAVVERLNAGQVIGFYHGRMEFGPRALGHRSILADPRGADMRELVNAKIKKREAFRPFAPSVPVEQASEWFDMIAESPYMVLTAHVKKDSIPAVTHVNGSARLQTVSAKHSPRYHRLLTRWGVRTGCPVLLNTSFNVRGEPIVCTPEDAYRCFRGSGLDALVLENRILDKESMPKEAGWDDYVKQFDAD